MSELRSNEDEKLMRTALDDMSMPLGPGGWESCVAALIRSAPGVLAEVTRLRTLVDQQLGECVGCNYQDGPDEYCPHHGRSYGDVLTVTERIITKERADLAAARVEVSQQKEMLDEFSALLHDARAKIERVETLHHSDGYTIPTCRGCGRLWPCPTAAALAEPSGTPVSDKPA